MPRMTTIAFLIWAVSSGSVHADDWRQRVAQAPANNGQTFELKVGRSTYERTLRFLGPPSYAGSGPSSNDRELSYRHFDARVVVGNGKRVKNIILEYNRAGILAKITYHNTKPYEGKGAIPLIYMFDAENYHQMVLLPGRAQHREPVD